VCGTWIVQKQILSRACQEHWSRDRPIRSERIAQITTAKCTESTNRKVSCNMLISITSHLAYVIAIPSGHMPYDRMNVSTDFYETWYV
jgi:hypothetical protein